MALSASVTQWKVVHLRAGYLGDTFSCLANCLIFPAIVLPGISTSPWGTKAMAYTEWPPRLIKRTIRNGVSPDVGWIVVVLSVEQARHWPFGSLTEMSLCSLLLNSVELQRYLAFKTFISHIHLFHFLSSPFLYQHPAKQIFYMLSHLFKFKIWRFVWKNK